MAQTKTAAKSASKTKTAKKAAPKKKAAAKTTVAKKAAKPAASKAKPAKKAKGKPEVGEEEVKLDRRRAAERRDEETAEIAVETPAETTGPKLERREKVSRRRQIDPTTCERDYSDSEVEFMNALDAYKRTSGRMFPTCSEVLEVIRGIGYTQLNPSELATVREARGETGIEPTLEDTVEADAEMILAESEELCID